MEIKIAVCTILTTTLWVIGSAAFLLISFGLIAPRHSGLALLPLIAGSVLYVRRLTCQRTREREIAAFKLGQTVGRDIEGVGGLHAVP